MNSNYFVTRWNAHNQYYASNRVGRIFRTEKAAQNSADRLNARLERDGYPARYVVRTCENCFA